MRSALLGLIAGALLGCDRPADPPARRAPRETAVAVTTTPRDSTWIDVHGPTLIAFWPAQAQAAIDSGGDAATALDDFGFHLANADSALRALGVRVVSIEGSRFHVVSGARATEFTVPRDSAPLGFYLVAPGRAPTILYGAQTDADLVDTARAYLAGGDRRP